MYFCAYVMRAIDVLLIKGNLLTYLLTYLLITYLLTYLKM